MIALTAGGEGGVARLFAEDQPDGANAYVDRLQAIFGDRLYIEIARRFDPVEAKAEAELLELAYARNLPIVATNPCCFAEEEFVEAHDAMLCIANSSYVASDDRPKSSPDAWMKPAKDMPPRGACRSPARWPERNSSIRRPMTLPFCAN